MGTQSLSVIRAGRGQFFVGYWVDLNAGEPCECEDSLYRLRKRGPCRHVRAALEAMKP